MTIKCLSCGKENRPPATGAKKAQLRCGSCKSPISGEPETKDRLSQIAQVIEIWKKHLLDLTRRNRLLYFAASKLTAVQITSPSIGELFKRLVEGEDSLSFPMPKKEEQLELLDSADSLSDEEDAAAIKLGDVETTTPVRQLQSKLYRLKRDFKTSKEEQGIHTLYVTFGMLHWQESEHEEKECKAPIILVPVALERDGTGKPYILQFEDEEVVLNPALAFKLEQTHGIALPPLPEDDLTWNKAHDLLTQIAKVVRANGWIVSEEAWLSRFTFEKFVMYKDLEAHLPDAANHPIICALTHADLLPIPSEVSGLDNLDGTVDPAEVFPVLDADSSQLEALVRTRAGQNLVIQGPPGTGKSQTIVNLIAQSLRDGKKVLFVSEKMAALEVVARRLSQTGLSFAYLEVHSHRSNKAKVIEELGKTLQERILTEVPEDAANRFSGLLKRRQALNDYVAELHKKRGGMKLSAYKVHGNYARLHAVTDLNFTMPCPKVMGVEHEQLEGWLAAIRAVANTSAVIDNYAQHPWKNTEFDLPNFSIDERDSLIHCTRKFLDGIAQLEESVSITAKLALRSPDSLEEVENTVKLFALLENAPKVADSWFDANARKLRKLTALAQESQRHASKLETGKRNLTEAGFTETILSLPLSTLLNKFETDYASSLRWFKQNYWRDLKTLREHWSRKERLGYAAAHRALKISTEMAIEGSWFREHSLSNSDAFGHLYRDENTNWDEVRAGLKWTLDLISELPGNKAPKELISAIREPETLRRLVHASKEFITATLTTLTEPRSAISKATKTNGISGNPLAKTPFESLRTWAQNKTDATQLDEWVSFLRSESKATEIGLNGYLNTALAQKIKVSDLERVFLKKFWKIWISEAHHQAPALNEFNGPRHEELIQEFRKLDRDLKRTTVALTQEAIQKEQPKRTEARSHDSQVGILLREMQKKRRHRPLRRLFTDIHDLLQNLKPCMLMSPLSVSAFLTKGSFHFDVVIFDEASQIPPEDAIGAIFRGTQVIVAGDSKQLPPTAFFQADLDSDDEDDNADDKPLESILDECAALPGFLPAPLRWHYRRGAEPPSRLFFCFFMYYYIHRDKDERKQV